jgi:ribonuclease R
LTDEGRPVEFGELVALLDIAESEREMFQRRLVRWSVKGS